MGTASQCNGLSTYYTQPLQMYTEGKNKLVTPYFVAIPVEILDYNDTINLSRNLFVTNPQRTVCDMFDFNTTERFIYESIKLYPKLYDFDELLEYANKRGLKERVLEYSKNASYFLMNLESKYGD